MYVTPKKHLGQHFLRDLTIAEDIVNGLTYHNGYKTVLEIGPGTGVLTDFLVKSEKINLVCTEIDKESIKFLKIKYPNLNLIDGDFLELKINELFRSPIGIIGNFPYNISSQIFFKILDNKDLVAEVVCMLQKEVAERMCGKPRSKEYGILTIFTQAWYETEYLFTVSEHVFDPPPKVKSGVIRLTRKANSDIGCNEMLFRKVVKQAFSMRRKTMRNAFKGMNLPAELTQDKVFDQRAEELSWQEFVTLTNRIYSNH
ncbi:MAG: 16S rRNA (adenine(1518)-N(6)/adenine(1519)-N(6))-dimethyltransferase RsmA [Bacteroidota bacterium]|nr:16S rRNA (adenine(1518)-N(6)/adenine(1519)-N(6))-dimethyltransferase RsmA [Bacteroidota bacterium]